MDKKLELTTKETTNLNSTTKTEQTNNKKNQHLLSNVNSYPNFPATPILTDQYPFDDQNWLTLTPFNTPKFIIIPANSSSLIPSNCSTVTTAKIKTKNLKQKPKQLIEQKIQIFQPTTSTSTSTSASASALALQQNSSSELVGNDYNDIQQGVNTVTNLQPQIINLYKINDNTNKYVNDQPSVNSVYRIKNVSNKIINNDDVDVVDDNGGGGYDGCGDNDVCSSDNKFFIVDSDNDLNNGLISQSDAIHQINEPSAIMATKTTESITTTPTVSLSHTFKNNNHNNNNNNNNKNNNNLTSYNSCSLPITTSISQTLGIVNLRPKVHNSSMRSVVSAHIPNDQDHQQQQLQQQQINLKSPSTSRILRSTSYIFGDSNTKIFTDATSVRSLASIGVGSTDGRKLVIKRVPNSPVELLSIVNPPILPPGDSDDDTDSYGYLSDDPDASQLKPRRQYWENKMQFVLACIGYSVGLGNVWRFPYMCYKSGGGVFLIPYFIILIICSTPMLYMELAVGQYTGRGPIGALGQICPLFKGVGLGSVIISFLMSTYYSVIIGYSIYYFFTSMKPEMPWTGCNNRWNTIDCWVPERKNANMTPSDYSRTPSEEFFDNKVLQISPGIEYAGLMRWELFACLICAWLLVYFATWKSIKSSGKVRYFTATFPFVLIIVLMGRALTLEGADNGLRYFFRPRWEELGNANVWINACSQNFNSLGIAFGTMISFASYNKYNNNILYDTLAVSAVNALTSILVGIFAFATLGNLAWELNTSVKDVISDGPGFIFVVYPQVMAKMPYAQLWAVMFFFMLLCLGLNSQFAIVEVVVTSIQDGFPNWIRRNLVYHEVLVLIVCVVSWAFGLPNIMQGGIYFFQLMDHYAASISIMFLAFFQMIAIAWFYGAGRLSKNVKQMTGRGPALYLKTCWLFCGPLLLFSLWIFSLINYKEPTYHNGQYVYPPWAYGIGWMITSLSLVCIPAYAIINIARASGKNLCDKLLNAMKPNIYECRICGEHHCEHDFPEEQYVITTPQQELVNVQPKILLKNPPPGHHQNAKNSPLLTPSNQPNTSVVMEDESSGGQFVNEKK